MHISTGIKILVFLSFFLLSLNSNAQIANFDGAIKLGNDTTLVNQAGTLIWNSDKKDFEGYNGQQWQSLTFNSQNKDVTFVSNEMEFSNAILLGKKHIVILDSIILTGKITLDFPVLIESWGISKKIEGEDLFLVSANNVIIRHINFESTGAGVAIKLDSGIENIWLDNLSFYGFEIAISKTGVKTSAGSRNIKITNTLVKNSSAFESSATINLNWNIQEILIDNVIIDGSTGEGVAILNGCSGKVSNLTILNTAFIGFELWNITNDSLPYNSFEVNNISARNCGSFGISFHGSRVTGSNLTTDNTTNLGVEIVGNLPAGYDYKPVQLSNILVSRVRANPTSNNPKGIAINKHSGANISNFHIEGMDTLLNDNLECNQGWGIQVRLSEHFTIHDGQFKCLDRGIMVLGGNQESKFGSIIDNRFINVKDTVIDQGLNIDYDNNISWE